MGEGLNFLEKSSKLSPKDLKCGGTGLQASTLLSQDLRFDKSDRTLDNIVTVSFTQVGQTKL